MTRSNLFSESLQQEGELRIHYVYESPCLKILKFRFDAGQKLLIYSDEIQGKVSLFVLGGYGELVGEVSRYSVEQGDLVVSEMSEPNSLIATTDLSVLVTVASSLSSSCELESHDPRLS